MRSILLATGVLSVSMLVSTQTNLVLLNSPAGEYIGQGKLYYSTNPTDFTVGFYGASPAAIAVYAFGFQIMLAGPNGTLLGVGIYSNGDLPGRDELGRYHLRGLDAGHTGLRVYADGQQHGHFHIQRRFADHRLQFDCELRHRDKLRFRLKWQPWLADHA